MIDSILLGLVEGLTEFLPVSSTGHLLLTQHLLGTTRSDAWNVLIQVAPILAAAILFRTRIHKLLFTLHLPETRREVLMLAVSFGLTAVGGFALQKLGVQLPDNVYPIAVATLVGSFVIFGVEALVKDRRGAPDLTWAAVFAIAGAQLLAAIFPGTSRSGACVILAMLVGLARPAAVEYSFLVGIPTMMAAGGYKLLKLVKSGEAAQLANLETLVAFVVATITAVVAVKWLLRYVQSHTFKPFAWYRLLLGGGLLVWAILGVAQQ